MKRKTDRLKPGCMIKAPDRALTSRMFLSYDTPQAAGPTRRLFDCGPVRH
jgi:hypothetical protein